MRDLYIVLYMTRTVAVTDNLEYIFYVVLYLL